MLMKPAGPSGTRRSPLGPGGQRQSADRSGAAAERENSQSTSACWSRRFAPGAPTAKGRAI